MFIMLFNSQNGLPGRYQGPRFADEEVGGLERDVTGVAEIVGPASLSEVMMLGSDPCISKPV